jgi:uncharacterized BrkB/YihY/UPF0761 family membrane protein
MVKPNFRVIKDKLIGILSTIFSFVVMFGGIICVIIFQKDHKSMLIIHEMQIGMLQFTLIVVLYIV